MDYPVITCSPKSLPRHQLIEAADRAAAINPLNQAPLQALKAVMPGFAPTPEHIAITVQKYWQTDGVHLTVGFLDTQDGALKARILSHMNAWATRLNVSFVESRDNPQVRIARVAGDGYWSYLGTDINLIPADQPTMNLESFSMDTPEREYHRVVRHETGHVLGCPHEHMRRELVDMIDPDRAIEYFNLMDGWSPEMVRAQVLTSIDDASVRGTLHADPNSIMCYQIPGSITKDGATIPGGSDIDASDYDFMAGIYPKRALAA